MSLPQEELTGVLRFTGWARSGKGQPYMVFTVGDQIVHWFFYGQVGPDLIGQEVNARVAVGLDRKFLKSATPGCSDDKIYDSSVEALQAMWDVQ